MSVPDEGDEQASYGAPTMPTGAPKAKPSIYVDKNAKKARAAKPAALTALQPRPESQEEKNIREGLSAIEKLYTDAGMIQKPSTAAFPNAPQTPAAPYGVGMGPNGVAAIGSPEVPMALDQPPPPPPTAGFGPGQTAANVGRMPDMTPEEAGLAAQSQLAAMGPPPTARPSPARAGMLPTPPPELPMDEFYTPDQVAFLRSKGIR